MQFFNDKKYIDSCLSKQIFVCQLLPYIRGGCVQFVESCCCFMMRVINALIIYESVMKCGSCHPPKPACGILDRSVHVCSCPLKPWK